jgi:hypothetical protein
MLTRLLSTQAARVTLLCLLAATGLLLGTQMATQGSRMLIMLAAAALVYLALFIWQPAVALLMFIAIRPMVDAFVYQGVRGFSLGELWGLGMIVSAIMFFLLESRDRKDRMVFALVPIGFLFTLAAITFTRPDLISAVSWGTKVASWVLVILVCERISKNRHGQMMCWWTGMAMSAAIIVAVCVMIAQHRYGAAFYADPSRGVSGQMPPPLSIGAVLLLPFSLTGVLLVGRRGLSLLVAAGLFASVVLSFVRTAYIGGLVVLCVLLPLTIRGRFWVRVFGLAVAVSLAAIVASLWSKIALRFSDLGQLSGSTVARGGAGSGRVRTWETAVHSAFDSVQHALLGRGAGAPTRVMMEALGLNVGAQNDFLDFLLIGGLVLGIAYLVLLAWMASTPLRILGDRRQPVDARRFAWLTLGAVAAFVVMGMLNGIATYQPSIAIGLLVGLARGVRSTPDDSFLAPRPAAAGRADQGAAAAGPPERSAANRSLTSRPIRSAE